ncbi:hypothetical protein FHU37_005450 [Allostreptomyces psammosilenae]|uniref:Uncharacterized protein n=1 Tax=Allostreptomyces psammosilenae TaxID=1892865 RepID=A0A853ACZ1_9ACTN|nr:hypothetical protein [Allostreptomyces psammosilenae]
MSDHRDREAGGTEPTGAVSGSRRTAADVHHQGPNGSR